MTDDQYERFVRMEMRIDQLGIDTSAQFTNLRSIETKMDVLLHTMEAGKISYKILVALGGIAIAVVSALPWLAGHLKIGP